MQLQGLRSIAHGFDRRDLMEVCQT